MLAGHDAEQSVLDTLQKVRVWQPATSVTTCDVLRSVPSHLFTSRVLVPVDSDA